MPSDTPYYIATHSLRCKKCNKYWPDKCICAKPSKLTEAQQLEVTAGLLRTARPHILATSNGKGHFFFELKGVTSQPIADLPVLVGDPDGFGDLVTDSIAEHARVEVYRTR